MIAQAIPRHLDKIPVTAVEVFDCDSTTDRILVEAYRFAVTFNHVSRAARLIHRSTFAID
jgi:hypothetical protein